MIPSINFNTPVIRIPGYESKYDFAGVSNSLVRIFDDYLQARIVQQFHFWLWLKKGGVILRGKKWIYKALIKLMNEAIVGFSEYQVRKAIAALVSKGILVREQLHREHYGAVHALSAYNRQYYHRIDYDALVQFIETQIQKPNLLIELPWHLQAETTETKGFVKVANQFGDLHEPVLRMSPNNTDTTFKDHRSDTPPLTPPGGTIEGEPAKPTSLSEPPSNRQEETEGNPKPRSQNTIESQPIPFTDVVARPLRVEQKVNKNQIVQKPVQVSASAESVRETVQELSPLETVEPCVPSVKPKSKRTQKKTPKGTKPKQDFGLAPWKSLEQFRRFYKALIASAYVRRMAKNLEALVNRIVNELKEGVPHPFWDDFIAGRPIGSSTRQEWQMPDGSPHPDFIEYLAEKLIKGNNTQTREIAISEALRIAKDPEQARFFWKECKVSLVNAKARTERDRALGVLNPVTPIWTHERVEPTIEEAAAASMEIKGINQQTTMAIEAASNSMAQLEGHSKREAIATGIEKDSTTAATADPWLEDKPKRKQSILEAVAEARGGIDQIPKIIRPKKAFV